MSFRVNDNKKRMIPIDLLDIDPMNKEIFGETDAYGLSEEIEREGFNGAIEVWEKSDGRYLISSGHTRYEAAKLKGAKEIPCLVEHMPENDEKRINKLIMSNVYQKQISPMAMARALKVYNETILPDMM